MLDFTAFFRYEEEGHLSEIIEDSSDWKNALHIPRIDEDVYLGSPGKCFKWYTVKAVRWFDSRSITIVVHNKRDQVEE